MQPEPVKEIVARIFQNIQAKEGQEGNVLEIWRAVAGKHISRHTKPVAFREGALVVNVDRASWLYEVTLCKPLLMRRLKKRLSPRQPLRELRFRIGAT